MSQGSPEDRLVVKWLADYTHFMCDRLNFPHDQGAGLLQEYLELTARASAQQPSASRYEKASSYPDIPASLHETQLAEHLLDPHLATHTQDRPAIYLEGLDRHDDVSTGNNADHLSNSMAIEASSSLPQLQSHPNNQHSGGMMPMDPRQSESSNPLPQPIQAMQDREPIGSVNEYDPLWVQEGNVDPEIVMGFQSRMKFDTLFRHGVIRPGDVLTLQVTIPNNGGDTETEAHLTVRPESPSWEQ